MHEVWFTWPKLFAASFVILAATSLIEGRALQAGLLAGAAYLLHPGALLYVPVLVVIALWPLVGAQLRRPRMRSAALVVAGVAVWLVGWRLFNGSHYTQTGFFDYLTMAGWGEQPTFHNWLFSRLESLRNTFVPLTAFLMTDDLDWGVVRGETDGVIYFFMQYWVGLPFGIAIVFFPLLLVALWRAARRWPWPFLVAVVLPLAGFAVYWPFREGMLRENLHAWVLALIAVVALQQRATGFGWLRSAPVRAILCLRAAEVVAMAVAADDLEQRPGDQPPVSGDRHAGAARDRRDGRRARRARLARTAAGDRPNPSAEPVLAEAVPRRASSPEAASRSAPVRRRPRAATAGCCGPDAA